MVVTTYCEVTVKKLNAFVRFCQITSPFNKQLGCFCKEINIIYFQTNPACCWMVKPVTRKKAPCAMYCFQEIEKGRSIKIRHFCNQKLKCKQRGCWSCCCCWLNFRFCLRQKLDHKNVKKHRSLVRTLNLFFNQFEMNSKSLLRLFSWYNNEQTYIRSYLLTRGKAKIDPELKSKAYPMRISNFLKWKLFSFLPLKNCFLKMDQPGLYFVYFRSFSNKYYNKLM